MTFTTAGGGLPNDFSSVRFAWRKEGQYDSLKLRMTIVGLVTQDHKLFPQLHVRKHLVGMTVDLYENCDDYFGQFQERLCESFS